MLSTIIKFLSQFLTFLKNREKKSIKARKALLENIWTNKRKFFSVSMIMTMLIWALIAFLITVFSVEVFDDNQLLSGWIAIIANLFLFYTLFRNLNWKYLFLVHLPLYIWIFSFIWIYDSHFYREFWIFSLVLNILLVVYPLIYIIQYYFKLLKIKCVDRLKDFSYLYNLGFFFFVSLNVILISIWFNIEFIQPWSMAVIEILDNNYLHWLLETLLYIIVVFVLLLYWVYTLHLYYDNLWTKRVNLHKWILIFLLVYCLGFTSNVVNEFYDYQISRATEIINKGWDNYDTYKDARVLFLDKAFFSRIKNGKRIDENLFNKIYDSTIASYYWEKVSEYLLDRSSFATNESKIWDSADVILKLAEIENNIFSSEWKYETSLLETTYKFHFTNETNISQEVILNFETPSKTSVISGLRLWMDLELIWQISSRGAARKVYEDSLRRNTDPALIEKVWLNTYSLKVFPIPSRTGKTWWRQVVEVKILTPILWEEFIYSPKFSITNLKFDDSSRLQSKVYNDDELIKEDIIKSNEIENYISMDHIIKSNELNIDLEKWFTDICLSSFIQNELYAFNLELAQEKKIWKKIKIFFDNSYSVDRNNANELYDDIYNIIKNYNGKLNDVDLYSYNFDVTKLTWVEDINYWWHSDIDRAIDYIVNNNIKNEKIIFITDDDSFNLNSKENISRNLEWLVTNNISVIKIWKTPKTYKSDFNTILSATYWNIYEINWNESIASVVDKILDTKSNIISFENCNEAIYEEDYNDIEELFFTGTWEVVDYIETNNLEDNVNILDKNIERIQAWIVSNLLLWNITNSSDWMKIANFQTRLAEEYNIVNQFNSLIAIETQQQQRDLDRYNKYGDKYNTEYENSWVTNTKSIWFREEVEFNDMVMDDIDFWMRNDSIDSFKSNRISQWINAWSTINNSIRTSWSVWFDMSFTWRTEISFVWLIIILIYLLEYIGFINFIIKYKRQK